MSRHKTGYVISYHGILCHDMSYVTTITASLIASSVTCNLQCSYNVYVLLVCSVIALVSLIKALHVSLTVFKHTPVYCEH